MGKKIKNIGKEKQAYTFVLKGNKTTHYKNKIQVDYTPSKSSSSIPTFNRDSNYFTPSFIVPSLYSGNKSQYRTDHQNKIQATQQKSEQNILVPRPRPSKNYCGVCSTQYQDYLDHIKSQIHKKSVKNSEFHQQIINLCTRVQSQIEEKKSRFINSMNSKNSISTQAHSQEETTSKDLILMSTSRVQDMRLIQNFALR